MLAPRSAPCSSPSAAPAPSAIDQILSSTLAKAAAQRPANAQALKAALLRSLRREGSSSDTAPMLARDERRQVAVLHAAFREMDRRAQVVGDEGVHGLLKSLFQLVDEQAAAADAFVLERGETGVQVIFGAPVAHEDDPVRWRSA